MQTLLDDTRVSVSYEHEADGKDLIVRGLGQHNAPFVDDEERVPLTVSYWSEEGDLRGGIHGYFWWHWLYINYLWVRPNDRKKGMGSELVKHAEREALIRCCVGVHLETFSFQAQKFYEKMGYEKFGALENFPRKHSRIFLRKYLAVMPTATNSELEQ